MLGITCNNQKVVTARIRWKNTTNREVLNRLVMRDDSLKSAVCLAHIQAIEGNMSQSEFVGIRLQKIPGICWRIFQVLRGRTCILIILIIGGR